MRDKVKPMDWFKALVLSFGITVLLIIIMSLILRFTNLREEKLPLLNNIIMLLSIAIASIYLAMQVREKGWFNGAILGFGYYLVIILINFIIVRPISLDLISAIKLIMATLIGAIGGMIGINLI